MRDIREITERGQELQKWKLKGRYDRRYCWTETICGYCRCPFEHGFYVVKHFDSGDEARICYDCQPKFLPPNYDEIMKSFKTIELDNDESPLLTPGAIRLAYGLGWINEKSRDFYIDINYWVNPLSPKQLGWKVKIETRIQTAVAWAVI
jgi:hypothetical protein